jgi:hypothetical protein
MTQTGSVKSGLGRRLVGKPRIWVAVVWSCIGLAWLLLSAYGGPDSFDGSNVTRIVLGFLWLTLGVLQGVVALLDRKHGRGFYRVPAPVRPVDEVREHE